MAMKVDGSSGIAITVRLLRTMKGFSQKGLGIAMGKPRTYISKIECCRATPTIASIGEFAEVFGISVYGFMLIAEAI